MYMVFNSVEEKEQWKVTNPTIKVIYDNENILEVEVKNTIKVSPDK
jgi:hypothetical protein